MFINFIQTAYLIEFNSDQYKYLDEDLDPGE